MKKISISALFILSMFMIGTNVKAQKFASIPKSPLSIAYYPSDVSTEGKAPMIKVIYSRPYKNGRDVFGGLLKFGEIWRAGANEETEIRFYKDATINGTTVPAGNYSLFIVPEKANWTFIINKQNDHWGAYSYDKSMDVVRATVPVKAHSDVIENFSITFTDGGNGLSLVAGWDKSMAELPIKL